MSVIIRLQNLSWNAHALDIRQFFKGMSIPDGGVHIVGGDLGDAFIAFTSDEDARKAMMLNGEKLNGISVKLYLSSKMEMQKVIAAARGGAPLDTDDRGDRTMLPMAHITVASAFAADAGGRGGGGGGAPPYSQPPPPMGLTHGRPGAAPMEAPNAPYPGNMGFNQGTSGPSPPYTGGPPPSRPIIPNFPPMRDAPRFPVGVTPPNPIPVPPVNFPSKCDSLSVGKIQPKFDPIVSGNIPPRPNMVRNEPKPNYAKRDGLDPGRRDYGEYPGGRDGFAVGYNAKEPAPSVVERGKSDPIREERRHGGHDTPRGSDRSSRSHERRGDSRGRKEPVPGAHQQDRIREERIETRRKSDDRKSDHRDKPEVRKSSRDGLGEKRKYEEAERRRQDRSDSDSRRREEERDRERRAGRSERSRRDDSRERRDSRKRERERERERSPERRHDRHREQPDSREREKRTRYGVHETEPKPDRTRDIPDNRPRHAEHHTNGDRHKMEPSRAAFITNLPTTISYKDVRRYFSNEGLRLPESGLKLENDEFGERNGNAFVMFLNPEQRDKALSLDGSLLGGNRIKIERCTMLEFEEAVDSFVPQEKRRRGIQKLERFPPGAAGAPLHPQPDVIPRESLPVERNRKEFFPTCCVMIRNLPARVERYDVRVFFRQLNITPNGVYIPFDNRGACLGVAYVEFETVPEAEEALRRYDGTEYMASKHIVDMYPITMAEAKERIESHKRDFMRGGGAGSGKTPPSGGNRRHDWAGDDRRNVRRNEGRVDEGGDRRGRSNDLPDFGEAARESVLIASGGGHRDDRRRYHSRDRDNNSGGHRLDERMGENVNTRPPPPQAIVHPEAHAPVEPPIVSRGIEIRGGVFHGGPPPSMGGPSPKFQCVKLSGLSGHFDVGQVEGIFFDLSVRPNGIHVVFHPDAFCAGVAYVEFTNVDDCSKALLRDNTTIEKSIITVRPISEAEMVFELNRYKTNHKYIVSRATPEAPGQPCDVVMSNVPFKANMMDVNQYLQGTMFLPESILFEVDQQGNAMGNVKVTFVNSQAAHRALLALLRKEFFGCLINFKVL